MAFPSSGTPFLEGRTFAVTPLRSTGISRFFATMSVSDLRAEPVRDLCLRPHRCPLGALGRLSQVPRPFCQDAPLPSTPDRPAGILVSEEIGGTLHPFRKAGHDR